MHPISTAPNRRRWVFRLLLTVVATGVLVWQLVSLNYSTATLLQATQRVSVGLLALALAVLPINYGLETLKWHHLMLPSLRNQRVAWAWQHSVQALMLGGLAGFLTPSRIGEYAGRSLGLPLQLRWQGGFVTFICRMGQWVGTLGFGLMVALLVLPPKVQLPNGLWLLGVVVGAVVLLVAFAWPASALRWASRLAQLLPGAKRVSRHLQTPNAVLIRISVALSLVRHAVIVAQYALLLQAFTIGPAQWVAYLGFACAVFVVKSAIPSLTLAEFGIREGVALLLAPFYGIALPVAFNATLALFFLNLVLPALLGLGALIWWARPTPAAHA